MDCHKNAMWHVLKHVHKIMHTFFFLFIITIVGGSYAAHTIVWAYIAEVWQLGTNTLSGAVSRQGIQCMPHMRNKSGVILLEYSLQ